MLFTLESSSTLAWFSFTAIPRDLFSASSVDFAFSLQGTQKVKVHTVHMHVRTYSDLSIQVHCTYIGLLYRFTVHTVVSYTGMYYCTHNGLSRQVRTYVQHNGHTYVVLTIFSNIHVDTYIYISENLMYV